MRTPFGSWITAEKSRLYGRLRQSYFRGTIHRRVTVNMALCYSFIYFFRSMTDFMILLRHRLKLHRRIRERGESIFQKIILVNLVCNYCRSLLSPSVSKLSLLLLL